MKTIASARSTRPADVSPVSSGPIGRIVAISLLGAAGLAVALAVFVVGGATEPVIAGAVLLAFAAGWGRLAWASQAHTAQPQRWAWLPAGVLGLIGLLYLTVRPGDAAMTATGWAWPVVLAGLAGWIVTRSRRDLVSRSRRLVVYPIAAVMATGAVGSGYESVREALDASAHRMAGQLVSVGDHKLHISCTGTGSPTVVLEPGLGEPAVMMAGWIQPAVASTTRVCSYDRAGRGDSEPASGPQDGPAMAADLHALLANAHVPGPYVLVGHSSGAVYLKVYAHQYPADVAGMVLLDPQPSNAYADLPGWSTFYQAFRRYSALVPALSRLGLERLVYQSASRGPAGRRAGRGTRRLVDRTTQPQRPRRGRRAAYRPAPVAGPDLDRRQAAHRPHCTQGHAEGLAAAAGPDAQPVDQQRASIRPQRDPRLSHRRPQPGRALGPGHH